MTENMEVPMRLPNAPSESSMEQQDVELTIRQAYQAENDLVFSCPLSWSIKQVKEHVQSSLDSHPTVSSQRLIFSGAPLRDEQILSNVLKERSYITGEQVFFHLMITQPYQATPTAELRQRNVLGAAGGAASQPTASPDHLHPAYAQNAAAWNQYWEAYNRLSPEEQTSENQRLMSHYYSYATQATPIFAQSPLVQSPLNAWRARIQRQPVIPEVAPAAQAPPPAPAQGRVDFLEVTYRVFKLVLLFSAILLYSSFERFALVLCAALFIYFIQLRRNHARHRAAQAAAQPAEVPVNNNNNGENEGNTPPAEGGEETAPPAAPAEPPQSSMQVFLATCYSFVTSFFASLVPDHPMPMDLN